MKPLHTATLLVGLMAGAAVVGVAARPAVTTTADAPRYVLENMVPQQFGTWQNMPNPVMAVVNPQSEAILNRIYSQILTRTYTNSSGYRIMLSIAYGPDQRASLQAHKPEVCYPAQGFKLHSNQDAQLSTPFGHIAARQLQTSLGERLEPVTYWFTMGDETVRSKFQQRLIEVRFGLTGEVPDGLLFRVSSIDSDPARAFEQQHAFVVDLLGAIPAPDRARLSGLTAATSPH